jgi:HEAT repeat protein
VACWSARADAKDDPVAQALTQAGRRDLPLADRLAAAARVLAAHDLPDAEAAVRAGVDLIGAAPETAGWLIVRGADAGWVRASLRARGAKAIDAALASGALEPAGRAELAAAGMLLGRRPDDLPAVVTAVDPLPDLVQAVVRRELGDLAKAEVQPGSGGSALERIRAALQASLEAARALDAAISDDPATMRRGLDALVALGAHAVPLLLHEARTGVAGKPVGRMPRAVRAIVALGFLGDRRATPVLADDLQSLDGWVRTAAASALGDLGDPAGAVALAVQATTIGDLFRARDQWDYPGTTETSIPQSEWNSLDYYCVDCAAADSLLRLGVPNAAGYLILRKLDPSKGNFRIRVFQDAHDALRRALKAPEPAKLVANYNVDAGLPQRDAAFVALARWWHAHRDDADLLDRSLDETDPGFRKAARALTEKLRGKDIRLFMITKPACALIGRAMTPTVIETLAEATKGSACAELCETLGLLRDRRAIPALLGRLHDERPFVRSRAARALATYVDGSDEVRHALIALLDDPKAGPRVAALKALVAAPPSPDVLAAVRAHEPAHPTEDQSRALTVLLLVQEGAKHWPPIEKGLLSPHRYVREDWWGLVRRALDLPAFVNNAWAAADAPRVRRLDRSEALAAVERRRRAR